MLREKIAHKEDNIFIWDQILETKDFLNYAQEFDESNNNWKFNKSIFTEHVNQKEHIELPRFGGLLKPHNEQGIGDNINFLDLSSKLKIIAEQTLKVKLNLTRINTNIQFFGQDMSLHIDASSDNFWTFLIFFNTDWHFDHGGEFLLIRPNNSTLSSLPLPNRGILFKANLYHKGCAPNRFCGSPRFSVACTYCEVCN